MSLHLSHHHLEGKNRVEGEYNQQESEENSQKNLVGKYLYFKLGTFLIYYT